MNSLNEGARNVDKFGISKLDLKRRNRMQILKLLRQLGPTSRIDISAELEITRAAVTIITNEMIEQGVIYEKGEASYAGKKATRGRKKILIDINANHRFAFGVAVDNNTVSIGLTNLAGETLEKTVFPLTSDSNAQSILAETVKAIEKIRQNNCLEPDKILGVGFCVSPDEYVRMGVAQVDLVPDFSALKKELEKAMPYSVTVSDTTNALALAEIDFKMSGVKPDNVMFFRYSTDITASLIIDNKPYLGAHGRGVDLAHIQAIPDGELCDCGNKGCLHTLVSSEVILDKLRAVYSKEATPALYEATGGNPDNIKVIFNNEKLMGADEPTKQICIEAADHLIRVLSNATRMFDPERVVIIGSLFKNSVFFNYIAKGIAKNAQIEEEERIYAASLDKKDVYLSGCSIAIRDFFVEKGGIENK